MQCIPRHHPQFLNVNVMFFRPLFLLILVPIVVIYSVNMQECAQAITPKIFDETDFLLKFSLYRALVAQMAGREIETERIIRSLDRKRQERIYNYYLTGPCEPYKAVMKAHENTTLPTPIKNYAAPGPIVSVGGVKQ